MTAPGVCAPLPVRSWTRDLDALYTTAPGEFIARREELTAQAKKAGRRDDAAWIHASRRPTLAAWALNVMRRSRPEESDQFLQLGVALREAHRTLDREQLRRLTGEQWRVVSALARETAALAGQAGHRLSDPVQRDVESTLRAVLADQAAADRWASGRLDATLTPPTLLPTPGTAPAPPPEPAVARPSRPLTRSRHDDELEQRRRERADRARQDLQAASSALTGARQTQADAEAALDAARGREQQAERELGAARQQLQKAEEERAAVGGAVKKATVARRAASTAVAKAERDRAAARAVDKLTP